MTSVLRECTKGFSELGKTPRTTRMALIPRWRYMSDEAKAVTRRIGWSALAILVVAVVLRPLLPWLALSILLYLIWQKRR